MLQIKYTVSQKNLSGSISGRLQHIYYFTICSDQSSLNICNICKVSKFSRMTDVKDGFNGHFVTQVYQKH